MQRTDPTATAITGAEHARGSGARVAARASTCAVLVVAALGVLALGGAPAVASQGYAFSKAIGGPGSALGEMELASDSGVAVADAAKDVYVADTANHRVDEFNEAGGFVLTFGREVNKTKVEGGISSEEEENLCTEEEIEMTSVECQAGVTGSGPGQFETPVAVTVDNAPGGEGDVYVADTGTGLVQKFTAGGKLEKSWGVEGQLTKAPAPTVTGNLTAGSDIVTATAGQFLTEFFTPGNPVTGVGEELVGEGIPAGARIVNCPENTRCELSKPATETRTGVAVTAPSRNLIEFAVAGAAVDSKTGELSLYSAEPGLNVLQFERGGGYVGQWLAPFPPDRSRSIGIDGAGDVYLSNEGGVVKFTSAGAPLTGGAPGVTTGLAASTAGGDDLYLDRGTSIEAISPTQGLIATFGSPVLAGGAGLAVQPVNGTVYAANTSADTLDAFAVALEVATGTASAVEATTATLSGEVNPEGGKVVACEFEYLNERQFDQNKGVAGPGLTTAACEPPAIGEGTTPVIVTAKLSGLTGGTRYEFRLTAVHENTTTHEQTSVSGEDEAFETLPVPVVTSGEVLDVTETSAELRTSLNPEGLPVSQCFFEYGMSTSYGQTAFCEQSKKEIGSGLGPVPVTAVLTGLSPNVEYHWRLIAVDANGSSLQATGGSPDHTFIYPLSGAPAGCPDEQARTQRNSARLPDCRAYELVTPPDKNGSLIDDLALDNVAPQITRDGGRVVVPSIQCFAAPESCVAVRRTEGDPYEFTRTPGGWKAQGLAPPASSYESNSWVALSANGGALFEVPSAPESLTDDWLARTEDGSLLNLGPLGEHPGEPPFPPEPPDYHVLNEAGVIATADLSHVVYETTVPVWSFDETVASPPNNQAESLYEYAGPASAPLLVGVKGGYQSHELLSACGTNYGKKNFFARKTFGSLSADGRIVYFMAEGLDEKPTCPGAAPPVNELYARIDGEQLEGARSVPISVDPPAGACKEEPCVKNAANGFQNASFEGASADGSGVFFTDPQQLTDHASQSSGNALLGCSSLGGPGGCNLYESYCPHCQELTSEQEADRRQLIDVSETNENTPVAGGPRVQGVVAVSEDGSRVYFVAKGVLTGAEENEHHERAEGGAENLYVYTDGTRTFIARLSPKVGNTTVERVIGLDEGQWREFLRANVTPDGRFLLFTSTRKLTPDDTREEGPAQVYEYDAQTSRLVRVSVGQDGYNDDGNAGEGDATIVPVDSGTGAASVPVRTDPSMSDDGQFVFFQSPVALVPGALDDVHVGGGVGALDEGFAQNVYEYHDGHVYLISDGRDTTGTTGGDGEGSLSPVELLGTDTNGDNVFFATFDQLVPEDTDTQRDFYDARVCSEAEPCTRPAGAQQPGCEGEGCQGAPGTPPVLGSPGGTATLNGPGNLAPLPASVKIVTKPKPLTRPQKLAKALKACRKDHSKVKRKRCEATARRQYGPLHQGKRNGAATKSSARRTAAR
jgi:hypothetical protein